MGKFIIPTEFAPAERESIKIAELQSKTFAQNRLLTTMVNAVSEMLVVLNDKRRLFMPTMYLPVQLVCPIVNHA